MTQYTDAFYDQITQGSIRSARKVVSHFLEVFKAPIPNEWRDISSVIDFGCGRGAWLSVFMEHGIEDVIGIDGDYVDRASLLIPEDRFWPADMGIGDFPEAVGERKMDLAVSLEVAEHLPEHMADTFVEKLCSTSDLILFSAAVPGQNGVGHINEQWPSYWVPKFASHGYECSPNFRFDFWHDEDVENWYRQNILVFAKDEACAMQQSYYESVHYWRMEPQILDVIHYNNWMGKI